ncbi:MAG: YhgN family NAAT transporter [Buchnera aphidicola (Periphyllus lyropictus)]|uniref:YhgN family NAAT transporter n=1 Tax=Buchnera aphidicola TaxID=9 RepID=UPI001EC704D0|nr:YhgN family NAAT transporter [Buchnera aphidicola]NIH16533.1 YhgN family NAAT transporter [Buchnera aphidicola (Periphyllus lyropictus)]USS94815.1 YhgN family NAAT transporter [Buchnera aphidicola (Periphyllus lyropictus)]
MKKIISITILLILIMDPLGNLPIFMTILKNFKSKKRKIILIREMLSALLIMIIFLFSGKKILVFLNLKTETVSISGGIILFFIAMKMIFPDEIKKKKKIKLNEEPFLVPLAIPLVAGPSILATLMLLTDQNPNQTKCLIISLITAWSITLSILLMSNIFLKIFGKKLVKVLEKIMGLILIMLSTQMFLDGIKTWIKN